VSEPGSCVFASGVWHGRVSVSAPWYVAARSRTDGAGRGQRRPRHLAPHVDDADAARAVDAVKFPPWAPAAQALPSITSRTTRSTATEYMPRPTRGDHGHPQIEVPERCQLDSISTVQGIDGRRHRRGARLGPGSEGNAAHPVLTIPRSPSWWSARRSTGKIPGLMILDLEDGEFLAASPASACSPRQPRCYFAAEGGATPSPGCGLLTSVPALGGSPVDRGRDAPRQGIQTEVG